MTRPEAAVAPVRVNDRCTGCGGCLLTCPVHAIRPRGGTLLVRADLCTGCGECIEVCPADAIDATGGGPLRLDTLPGPDRRSLTDPCGGDR